MESSASNMGGIVMNGEHQGRIALVTGGSKGLGREVALRLAQAGATVVANYRSDKKAAEEILSELRMFSKDSMIIQADITDSSQVDFLFGELQSKFGKVDILVNNVGDFIFKPLMETRDSEFVQTIESNLFTAFFCTTRALALMGDGYGRVINIGAVGADRMLLRKLTTPYYIAKTGLVMLSKVMALDCKNGVTINVVSPGILENGVRPTGAAVIDYSDVSNAVMFLTEVQAQNVNGANIEVSGGWVLGMQ